jgi:ethanolamine kinase
MGSEGRGWNGAAAGTGDGTSGREEKPTTTAAVAAVTPADVPTSAASVDITLPLPEMTPHIIAEGICKRR